MSRTEDLLESARRHLIRFHAIDEEPPILSRGQGSAVWDVEGNQYLDFVSGQVCATIGHSHPRLASAIREAVDKMIHCNDFLLSDDAILLAERLAELLPEELSHYVFKSTGSEANEVAIYMAKIFTGNYEIVSPDRSFFGNTAAPRASTFRGSHRNHGPNLAGTYALPAPYCYRCPLGKKFPSCEFACVDVGFALYDRQSAGSPAAVIAEPLQSGGGIIDPPPGYLERLRTRAHERGMLLILDEAQTGLGRLGTMFAFEQDGIVPDILTLSKTLGAGIPLSAAATTAAIEQKCFERKFIMGSSHTNDPLPARAGLAVLEVLRAEDLPAEAKRKGEHLKQSLQELAVRFEIIGDVRGRGLLLGIELVIDRESKAPAEREAHQFAQACTRMGLLVSPLIANGENAVIRIAPPLTITDAQIDQALEIIEKALGQISSVERPIQLEGDLPPVEEIAKTPKAR